MFYERFVLSRGLETGYPLIIPSSVEGLHVLHTVHSRFFPLSILSMLFHFLARASMVQRVQPFCTHLGQGSQFTKRVLLRCSSVSLLLDYSVPVLVIINTINRSHLCQMSSPVSIAGLSIEFFNSGDLHRGGWWWSYSRWLLFLFLRSTFLFAFQDGLSVLHIPLLFTLARQFRIFVGHTEQNWFLSREFVYIYRLVRQTQISVQE